MAEVKQRKPRAPRSQAQIDASNQKRAITNCQKKCVATEGKWGTRTRKAPTTPEEVAAAEAAKARKNASPWMVLLKEVYERGYKSRFTDANGNDVVGADAYSHVDPQTGQPMSNKQRLKAVGFVGSSYALLMMLVSKRRASGLGADEIIAQLNAMSIEQLGAEGVLLKAKKAAAA